MRATEQALQIHPNSPSLILRKANLAFQLKDTATAFELIELIQNAQGSARQLENLLDFLFTDEEKSKIPKVKSHKTEILID